MLFPLLLAAATVTERPVTPAEQGAVRRYFDGVLFDGQSARWRFDKVRGDLFVCGYVNAKNQLGAFTGWKPFYWSKGDKTGGIDTRADPWFARVLCTGRLDAEPGG